MRHGVVLSLGFFFDTVDDDWESHHDHLAYVGYEVDYPDDDFDELELHEVFFYVMFHVSRADFSLQHLFIIFVTHR